MLQSTNNGKAPAQGNINSELW